MRSEAERLLDIVRGCDWLMSALRAARELDLSHWCIAAGAVRNSVWDTLHDRQPDLPADIDLVHFDASDTRRERDTALEARLAQLAPTLPWQVTNQAGVHLWYAARFGGECAPLRSLQDGLMSWPETATAVGVWLDHEDGLHILAPFGLVDLFALHLRHNDARCDALTFHRRLHEKGFLQRWPKLRLACSTTEHETSPAMENA